jgi:alpha 1,2-mannosyltransferase
MDMHLNNHPRQSRFMESLKRLLSTISIFSQWTRKRPHVEIFRPEGIRTINLKLNSHAIERHRRDWVKFVDELGPAPPSNEESRGIVICGGGVCFLTCAWVNIRILRHHGCTLPIELWHLDNEMTDELAKELQQLGVECRNLNRVVSINLGPLARWGKNYAMKPFCILYSRFTHILYLDADNVAVADPTYLFDHEIFKAQGAVFWPDFWRTDSQNPIWNLINDRSYSISEQDSGQLLVDKSRSWRELNLCVYFNKHGELYYRLLHYDKDTFKFAWLALKSPFFMVPFEPGSCGHLAWDGTFIGNTMVQHDYSGKIIFLHRNLLKWDVTRNDEILWHELRKFKPNARSKEYRLGKLTSSAENGMDLRGDIEIVNIREMFPDLELLCLKFLRELRESPAYAHFLVGLYVRRFRGEIVRP